MPFVPQERVQNRTPEQTVDVPLPQTVEERVQNRTHEQIVDSPVPQIIEAGVQVSFSMPQERVQNCTQEQIMDFPEPRVLEAVPLERIQEFIVEQISVVPQTTENFVSAVQAVPSERIRERLVEQISVVPLDHGEMWASARAFRADPRTTRGFGFHQRSGQVQHASTWRCYGPCASDHGGCRGGLCSTGVRAESYAGADCGFRASDHRGRPGS